MKTFAEETVQLAQAANADTFGNAIRALSVRWAGANGFNTPTEENLTNCEAYISNIVADVFDKARALRCNGTLDDQLNKEQMIQGLGVDEVDAKRGADREIACRMLLGWDKNSSVQKNVKAHFKANPSSVLVKTIENLASVTV